MVTSLFASHSSPVNCRIRSVAEERPVNGSIIIMLKTILILEEEIALVIAGGDEASDNDISRGSCYLLCLSVSLPCLAPICDKNILF